MKKFKVLNFVPNFKFEFPGLKLQAVYLLFMIFDLIILGRILPISICSRYLAGRVRMSFTSTHKPSPTPHFTDHNQPTLGSNPVCQCGTSIGCIVRPGRVDLWLPRYPFLLFTPHYRKLRHCTLVLMSSVTKAYLYHIHRRNSLCTSSF
jgi:hypothetical protein